MVNVHNGKKIGVLGLASIVYFSVAGGPAGTEFAVSSAGPLLTLLGFIIMPVVWGVPESLVTAELSTAFPHNGGYVIWVANAFGETAGFVEGILKFFSGMLDNCVYPVYMLQYARKIKCNSLLDGGPAGKAFVAGVTTLLSAAQWNGLEIVGTASVVVITVTMIPFAVMVLMGIGHIKGSNLVQGKPMFVPKDQGGVDWALYLATMFWNNNYWDAASTLADEVDNPVRTFPRALGLAMVFVVTMYLSVLGVAIGNTPTSVGQQVWCSNASFPDMQTLCTVDVGAGNATAGVAGAGGLIQRVYACSGWTNCSAALSGLPSLCAASADGATAQLGCDGFDDNTSVSKNAGLCPSTEYTLACVSGSGGGASGAGGSQFWCNVSDVGGSVADLWGGAELADSGDWVPGGGPWLRDWIVVSVALSFAGLFLADLSCDTFMLDGMAEIGMLPKCFSWKNSRGIPYVPFWIQVGFILVFTMLVTNVEKIVAYEMVSYCVSQVVEFVAFVRLRQTHASVKRPFRVPGGVTSAAMLISPAIFFTFAVMVVSPWDVWVAGIVQIVLGFVIAVGVLRLRRLHPDWFVAHGVMVEGVVGLPVPEEQEEIEMALIRPDDDDNDDDDDDDDGEGAIDDDVTYGGDDVIDDGIVTDGSGSGDGAGGAEGRKKKLAGATKPLANADFMGDGDGGGASGGHGSEDLNGEGSSTA